MKRPQSSSGSGRKSKVIEIRKSSTTVKIYPVQNRGETLFMVTWFVAGKRHRKNFRDEEAARREAALVANKMSAGQAQVLSLTSTERESYLHAKRALARIGVPLHDAIQDYVAAREILKNEPLLPAVRFYAEHGHQRLTKKSVEEVVADFLKIRKQDGCSERYLQDIRSRLGRFAEAFHMGIADVGTVIMDEWIRSLNVAARSRKNFRILLVALFNFAKSCGYLAKDATTAADALPVPKIAAGEVEIYSPEEMMRMLQAADEHTLPLLCLGGFAGLRTAEILRLTWENLKWAQNVIEIKAADAKTKQRRLIPILPPLRSFLLSFADHHGPVIKNINLQHHRGILSEQAGVKWKDNGLRNSFASYRLAVIKSTAQVALEMGNSPRMVEQSYLELVTEQEAARWWKIARAGGEKIIPITKVQ